MRLYALLILFACGGSALPSSAMDVHLFFVKEWKRTIVVAEGEIKRGDAELFQKIAATADRDEFGNVTMVLNSLGGDVQAAMEMVPVMDVVGVTAIIPPNGYCASACAAIVYVSADKRAIEDGGYIGFHSCYDVDGKGTVTNPRNDLCNNEIADNALAHGVCYGVVDVWTKSFGPNEMAWMDQELACKMGLCSPEIVPNSKSCFDYVDGLVGGFLKDAQ